MAAHTAGSSLWVLGFRELQDLQEEAADVSRRRAFGVRDEHGRREGEVSHRRGVRRLAEGQAEGVIAYFSCHSGLLEY